MPGKTKPQICGIGQPLLDITATVGDGFLNRYGLNSNDSILANEDHTNIFQVSTNFTAEDPTLKNFRVLCNAHSFGFWPEVTRKSIIKAVFTQNFENLNSCWHNIKILYLHFRKLLTTSQLVSVPAVKHSIPSVASRWAKLICDRTSGNKTVLGKYEGHKVTGRGKLKGLRLGSITIIKSI